MTLMRPNSRISGLSLSFFHRLSMWIYLLTDFYLLSIHFCFSLILLFLRLWSIDDFWPWETNENQITNHHTNGQKKKRFGKTRIRRKMWTCLCADVDVDVDGCWLLCSCIFKTWSNRIGCFLKINALKRLLIINYIIGIYLTTPLVLSTPRLEFTSICRDQFVAIFRDRRLFSMEIFMRLNFPLIVRMKWNRNYFESRLFFFFISLYFFSGI